MILPTKRSDILLTDASSVRIDKCSSLRLGRPAEGERTRLELERGQWH